MDQIGIVIPVYNDQDNIGACLDSIDRQVFGNFDMTVCAVDDGSTDHTSDVLRSHDRVDFHIRIRKNRGANAARMTGINLLGREFDYYLFPDSDCEYFPTFVKSLWEELALYDFREMIRKGWGIAYSYCSFCRNDDDYFYPGEWDPDRLLSENYISMSTLIKGSSFCRVGGFDMEVKRLQDWDLWLRMKKMGYAGSFVNKVLFRKKERDNSISNDMTYEHHAEWLLARHAK